MLFAENHTTVENTVFYQDAPENSDVSAPFGCENPKAVDTTGLFGRESIFPLVPWLLFDYHFQKAMIGTSPFIS